MNSSHEAKDQPDIIGAYVQAGWTIDEAGAWHEPGTPTVAGRYDSEISADLHAARWALDYLLFEDGQSKCLSVHGATCLDVIRRYVEAQEDTMSCGSTLWSP